MTVKDKALAFIDEYNQQFATLNDKINATDNRLDEIILEILAIEDTKIPEAVEIRVLTGDRSLEQKFKKKVDRLQAEKKEIENDLVVFKDVLFKFQIRKADELKQIYRLFTEDKNMAAKEAYGRMTDALKAYKDAISKESEALHVYRRIEADLQEIEVLAGRRKYKESNFPIHFLDLVGLSLKQDEIVRIAKGLK